MTNSKAKTTILALASFSLLILAVVAARYAPQGEGFEYAVFVSADDGRAAWVSADTILIDSVMSQMLLNLGSADIPDWAEGDERWGLTILNYLGSKGWELTAVDIGGFRGDNLGPNNENHRTYYLKRSTIGG